MWSMIRCSSGCTIMQRSHHQFSYPWYYDLDIHGCHTDSANENDANPGKTNPIDYTRHR